MSDSIHSQVKQLHQDFKIAADRDPNGKVPNSIIETINNFLEFARKEEPDSEILKKLVKLDPVDTKNIEALLLAGQIATILANASWERKKKERNR
jgi:hypothetical protein